MIAIANFDIAAPEPTEQAESTNLPQNWVKFELWPETTVFFNWKTKDMTVSAPLNASEMAEAINKLHQFDISAEKLEQMVL